MFLTKSDKLGLIQYYRDQIVEVPNNPVDERVLKLETFDDLLKRDEQREKDGFPKKIRIGKLIDPQSGGKRGSGRVVVVPTTREEKLIHSPFNPDVEDQTGGEGEGEEGDVVGEKPIDQSDEGDGDEGEDQGAGQGSGGDHGLSKEVYETGKILTEQFNLPNIQEKGKKVAIPQYTYDLTDIAYGFGLVLDLQKTAYQVCKTNILLGRLTKDKKNSKDFIIRPEDMVYKVLSKERVYESQAIVFLCRDYSGSMHGEPTEVVVNQHLMIYSWLTYQYENKVIPRFILHDTEAKEVDSFDTYYRSQIGGGTMIASCYELVNQIIVNENLDRDYNIYVVYSGDGDDWKDRADDTINELEKLINVSNRVCISIARSRFNRDDTAFERKLRHSRIEESQQFKIDSFNASEGTSERLIESIKYLMSEM